MIPRQQGFTARRGRKLRPPSSAGLAPRGNKFVELAALAGPDRVEAGIPEKTQAGLVPVESPRVEDVDGAVSGGLARGGDAGGVVEVVAGVGLRPGRGLGPDYVVVPDPGCLEGVHERQIPPALLDEDHVPQRTPVVQDGRPRRRVLRHGLDERTSPVVAAAVVLTVRSPRSDKKDDERQRAQGYRGGPPHGGRVALRQSFRSTQQDGGAEGDPDREDEVTRDQENVEVLNPVRKRVGEPPHEG